jgi:hypothetical protein
MAAIDFVRTSAPNLPVIPSTATPETESGQTRVTSTRQIPSPDSSYQASCSVIRSRDECERSPSPSTSRPVFETPPRSSYW